MLKIVFCLTLLVGFAACANLHRHNFDDLDQYLSYSSTTCGELRKQFENGYIHLKDFLDKIRNCKETKGFSRHHRRHHHHDHDMTNSDFYDPNYNNKKGDYSYTDYLVPVMRDATPTIHTTVNFNSDATKPATVDGHFVSPLMQNQAFDSQGNPNTQTYVPRKQKTINGIVVDSVAGQLILRSLQNNVMGNQRFSVPTYTKSFQQPTTYIKSFQQPTLSSFSPATTTGNHPQSWSEYFQYRNLLDNMGYDKHMSASSGQTDLVNKIDQALARSQLAHPDSESLTSHQTESPFYSTNRLQSPFNTESYALLNSVPNMPSPASLTLTDASTMVLPSLVASSSNTKDPSPFLNKAVTEFSTLTVPTNTVGFQTGSNLIPGITTSADLQTTNPVGVTDLSSKVSFNDLKKVDDDLEDDVSLLSDNNSRQRHLSLTNYESFTPQIVEKIAERSKINRGENNKHENASKRILAMDALLDGSNSAKDILDIKYAQLERKLLTDLRRRQSILQRLEQESMIHHFSLPGTIPLSRLGDVFQKINAETEQKTSKGIRKSIENSILSKQQALQLQDELGLFETNQKPTEKRSLADFAGVQIDSLSNQGVEYIAHHLPQNFMLSYYKDKAINPDKNRFKSDQILHNPIVNGLMNTTKTLHTNITRNHSGIVNASSTSQENMNRAMKILKKQGNAEVTTTTTKEKTGEKRTNIASKPKPEKPEIFSRNVLFTNKLFNEVIRAAMRRKNTIEKVINKQSNNLTSKADPHTETTKLNATGNNTIQKKDVILGIREKLQKRRFKIIEVNRGITNAKNRLNHIH